MSVLFRMLLYPAKKNTLKKVLSTALPASKRQACISTDRLGPSSRYRVGALNCDSFLHTGWPGPPH